MVNLKRLTGTVWEFWQAWLEGSKVIVNFGVVGSHGNGYEIRASNKHQAEQILRQEQEAVMQKGFTLLTEDDYVDVFLTVASASAWDLSDLDTRHEIQDALTNALGWTGNGECTGGDISATHLSVCCKVRNVEFAERLIRTIAEMYGWGDRELIFMVES